MYSQIFKPITTALRQVTVRGIACTAQPTYSPTMLVDLISALRNGLTGKAVLYAVFNQMPPAAPSGHLRDVTQLRIIAAAYPNAAAC